MTKGISHYAVLLICFVIELIFSSCNSVNTFPMIYFSVPNKIVKTGIDSIYSKNPAFKIPLKWRDLDDWSKRGLGFLDRRIFYFQSSPEEMYYITFAHYKGENTQTCSLGIMAVNQGGRWFEYTDLTDSEKIRIEERFEREIVSKLQAYTHNKAIVRPSYGAPLDHVK